MDEKNEKADEAKPTQKTSHRGTVHLIEGIPFNSGVVLCDACGKATETAPEDESAILEWGLCTYAEEEELERKADERESQIKSVGTLHTENYRQGELVFGKGNTWYFWDETGADYLGPFETEEKAKEVLRKYTP